MGRHIHLSTSNAVLWSWPYRKTAKSLSNEITRKIPSRSMSAKEVRSTREKSWSGNCSPIAHAASRSVLIVCSIVATPFRRPFQNSSAAWAEIKWWMRRQVSINTWSLVTSGSFVAKRFFARLFWRSPRSAAAYQTELSTKILIVDRRDDASPRRLLLRSSDLFAMRRRHRSTCRDRRRWNGRSSVGVSRPNPDLQAGACTRQWKYQERPHAPGLSYATPN